MSTVPASFYVQAMKIFLSHEGGAYGMEKLLVESDISDDDLLLLVKASQRAKYHRDYIRDFKEDYNR